MEAPRRGHPMSAGNGTGAEGYAAAGGSGGVMLGSQGHVVAVMGNAYLSLEDWLARRWAPEFICFTRTNVQILTARTSASRTGWRGRQSEVCLLAVLVRKYQY